MKVCSKCKIEKPATTEYFHKDKNKKDGFTGICKTCKKKYYEENKEYFTIVIKEYREENKEHYQEIRRNYLQENKEEIAIKLNKNYEENKEYRLECRKEYYKKNKEKVRETIRQYSKENPHISRQYRQRRKALERKLPHTLTIEEWNNTKKYFNNSCAYCGITEAEHLKKHNEQLHQEHFIPISKDGEYTRNNIIPACKTCNGSKNNNDFFKWYSNYEFYDKGREKFILEYLGYKDNIQQLSILL